MAASSPGVGAVQQALQQGQRARAVAGADGVSQLVKRALLGASTMVSTSPSVMRPRPMA